MQLIWRSLLLFEAIAKNDFGMLFSRAVFSEWCPNAALSVSCCLIGAVNCVERKLSFFKFRTFPFCVPEHNEIVSTHARQDGLHEHNLVLVKRLIMNALIFLTRARCISKELHTATASDLGSCSQRAQLPCCDVRCARTPLCSFHAMCVLWLVGPSTASP